MAGFRRLQNSVGKPLKNVLLGVGVDCVEVCRFDYKTLQNKRLLKKIFTKNEINYCSKKAKPSQHFAARFAGKEAIIKALSGRAVGYNMIEIVNNNKGVPAAKILSSGLDNLNIKISLSHTKEMAMAFAVVLWN